MTARVVVGMDGSSTAQDALAWSLEAAGAYGAAVEVVHAWRWPVPDPPPAAPDLLAQLAAASRRTIDAQVQQVRAGRPADAPSVDVTARTVEDDPGPALVAAATGAELLVVGRHGQSQLTRRLVGQLLGGVTAHCLSAAPAPVVVVPADARAGGPERVVVGVDGSDASARALRWGAGHARAVDSPLVAVLTWQLTSLPAPASATAGVVPPLSEWHTEAERLLDRVCQAALGADAQRVEQVVLHRPAAAGLMGAVTAGDLLALGDRGRGGFERLLLGSVSRQCAEHAPCPVVVVPPRDRLVDVRG